MKVKVVDGTAIGMSKHQAYLIGGALLVMSAVIFIPTGFDDLIVNVPIAMVLVSFLGIGLFPALVLTYTIIPMVLFLIGIWIYPGPTINNLKKRIHRVTGVTHRLIHNPVVWFAALLFVIALAGYYYNGGHPIIDGIISSLGVM